MKSKKNNQNFKTQNSYQSQILVNNARSFYDFICGAENEICHEIVPFIKEIAKKSECSVVDLAKNNVLLLSFVEETDQKVNYLMEVKIFTSLSKKLQEHLMTYIVDNKVYFHAATSHTLPFSVIFLFEHPQGWEACPSCIFIEN